MARIIDNQTNVWGRQQGVDIQRSDQWVVNFNRALSGLDSTLSDTDALSSGVKIPYVPPKLASYYAYSVNLPDLKTKSEPVRRASRPYPMPGCDEPLEAIRISFILDSFKTGGSSVSPFQSDLYQMLEAWRACVRAGRGSMSNEFAITLNGNYRIDFAFDVWVMLMRSSSNPTFSAGSTQTSFRSASEAVSNDLEFSLKFRLVNCWLGGFKLSELNYEAAKATMIEAVFYADDILQDPRVG